MAVFDASKKPSLLAWIAWSLSSAIFLFIWPSLKFGYPVWKSQPEQWQPGLIMAVIHLAASGGIWLKLRLKDPDPIARVLVWQMAGFGLLATYLFLSRSATSRMVFPITMAASFSLQWIAWFLLRKTPAFRRSSLVAGATALLLLLIISFNPARSLTRVSSWLQNPVETARKNLGGADAARKVESYLDTVYYPMKVTTYKYYMPWQVEGGGGMTFLDKYILLVNAEGRFFLIDLDEANADKVVTPLNVNSPFNRKEFGDDTQWSANPHWFRTTDIDVQPLDNNQYRIYLGHHFWYHDKEEVVLRLSWTDASVESLLQAPKNLQWTTLWESKPGLKLHEKTRPNRTFAGLRAGGRIQFLDQNTILFSTGDHVYDGVNATWKISQDDSADYGKIIQINRITGESSWFTKGNRNPQGLLVTKDKQIWETEHGPQGGDELNRLEYGLNYGWPEVTFGTQEETFYWPLTDRLGDHGGYTYPVFAWLPSVGISNLIQLQSARFPQWQGNLLVASLHGLGVYRVQIHENRVIVNEYIPLGYEIRDLLEDDQGRIIFCTDDGHIGYLVPTLEGQVEIIPEFATCIACHSLGLGGGHGTGPNLRTVMNRRMAAAPKYNYSEAFTRLNGQWTEKTLNQFLENPQAFAPGTSMSIPGLQDSDTRKAIIRFLGSLD